jgi:hypothetical protein
MYSHCTDLHGAWDWERIVTDAYYQCVSGCRITGEEMLDASHAWVFAGDDEPTTRIRNELQSGKKLRAKWCMANAGRWLQTNPRPIPRQRSRHFADLHCLDDDMTFGRFALIFAKASSDPAALSTAMNEHMGLPVKTTVVGALDGDLIDLLRAPYRAGEFPWVPDAIYVGGDTQDHLQKAVVIGVRLDGPDYEIAISDWHYVQTAGDMDDILDHAHPMPLVARAEFERSNIPDSAPPPSMSPALAFVDLAGHRTDFVYDQNLRNSKIIPCKGSPTRGLKQVVWGAEIEHQGRKIQIYHVADEKLKHRIYKGMIGQAREILAASAARRSGGKTLSVLALPGRLYFPGLPRCGESQAEFDRRFEEVRAELTAEIADETGRWVKLPGRNNDFGDALKYAIAAFDYLRPDLEAERSARESGQRGPVVEPDGKITR